MGQHRLSMSDLAIGEPLPWNVYDAAGHLLLSKGHVLERNTQLEALVERGMFADAQSVVTKKPPPVEKPKELPSVLRLINLANKRLESLLINLPNETDAQPKLIEVAKALVFASTLDTDVALASILLNQSITSYPIRHCVDTAVVSLLVARSMAKPPEEIEIITAAALTMNVAMLRLQEKLQNTAEPLTEEELRHVREHPLLGIEQLKRAGVSNQAWLDCVLMHHENEDGSGYPIGKSGAEIPLSAKIVSISARKFH